MAVFLIFPVLRFFYIVQGGPSICGGTDHDTVNRVVVVGEFAFAASQGYRINTATNQEQRLEGNRAKQYCG